MSVRRHVTRFFPSAQRDMLKIPLAEARRILQRLTDLQNALDGGDTSALDIKALSGHQARWRLRVGDWRVVYTVEPDADGSLVIVVWVLAAGHRREVYRTYLTAATGGRLEEGAAAVRDPGSAVDSGP